jgi:hypothetical protein
VQNLRLPDRWFRLLAGSMTLTALAACGGAAPPARPSPTSPAPPAPPASSPPDPRVAVVRAYLGMWDAFVAASRTADYQSPALARYAAGDALSVLTHGLYADYRAGVVTRGQPSFRPVATVVSPQGAPARASVTDCADSSRWLNYFTSGKPDGGPPTGRRRIRAQLLPFDGEWKVTVLVVGKEGSC